MDDIFCDLTLDSVEFFAATEAKPLVIQPLLTRIKVSWHLNPLYVLFNSFKSSMQTSKRLINRIRKVIHIYLDVYI